DLVGYGKLMIIAFLLHTLSVVLTLAAPFAFQQYGKEGAYYCLFLGAWSFSLANGTCEAVINPLTASLFPKNKTHWLNILHAGWPGGLVLGALVSLLLNKLSQMGIEGITWQVRWGIVFAPMFLYGVLMIGRRFPISEAKESGVSTKAMMGEVGLLGSAVVVALLGLWLSSDIFPWLLTKLGLSESLSWLGWALAAVLWIGFGSLSRYRLGHFMLAFLYVLHALVGYVELGTDSWIIDITKTVLASPDQALTAFIWTNVLMFTLRFFAGPIVHKISPVGLLFASAVIGTVGLLLLGYSATTTTWLWMGAVTVYGLGKTFYWPTMLGVISERFPKGGALALGFSGGVGMLSAGILGGPLIGYKQDYAATAQLKQVAPAGYERYKSDEPKAPLPALPLIAGVDNGKVGVLDDYEGILKKEQEAKAKGETLKEEDKKLQLQKDLELIAKENRKDETLEKRWQWWETSGISHAKEDY